MALGDHKTGFEESKECLSSVWGSLTLVWADIFLTCFSLSENSRKTYFFPEMDETQFRHKFVLSFLFATHFTDKSTMQKSFL